MILVFTGAGVSDMVRNVLYNLSCLLQTCYCLSTNKKNCPLADSFLDPMA